MKVKRNRIHPKKTPTGAIKQKETKMSGRGFSGRNCGGRGVGSRGKIKKAGGKPTTKKTITDYNYYLGSATQASDYNTTTEYIIGHIKQTFENGKDIGDALENLEHPNTETWKPSMQVSIATTPEVKELEKEEYKVDYRIQSGMYFKRLEKYEYNKSKACALLWERCAKGMKSKLEARKDYETVKDDPVLMLKAIREHALDYQETKYDMHIT